MGNARPRRLWAKQETMRSEGFAAEWPSKKNMIKGRRSATPATPDVDISDGVAIANARRISDGSAASST